MNCPNGCDGCPNPICACGENPTPQNHDNLDKCVREKSLELGQCYLNCKGNVQCGTLCWEAFKSEFESCPCQVSSFNRRVILIFFRPNVTLDAPVTNLNVNRIKNLCWC